MNTLKLSADHLRKIAAATGLDGIANEILAVANELEAQAPIVGNLVDAAKGLIHNQETGWRSAGMPEEHIQTMPYLKPLRTALEAVEGQS